VRSLTSPWKQLIVESHLFDSFRSGPIFCRLRFALLVTKTETKDRLHRRPSHHHQSPHSTLTSHNTFLSLTLGRTNIITILLYKSIPLHHDHGRTTIIIRRVLRSFSKLLTAYLQPFWHNSNSLHHCGTGQECSLI
jgi:hypothetical protein